MRPATDPLLSITETADLLGVGVDTIYRWRTGRDCPEEFPPAFMLNNRPRYRRSELLAWLDAQREPVRSA